MSLCLLILKVLQSLSHKPYALLGVLIYLIKNSPSTSSVTT